MASHDPLGDLHRPHPQCADARQAEGVDTGARGCARACSTCSRAEGYHPRLRFSVEHASGRSELEIELKYFDGAPVIREIARVSKPGRRVYASVKNLPRVNNGLGMSRCCRPPKAMHGGPRRARRERGRGNPLHGVLTEGTRSNVSYRQAAGAGPRRASPPTVEGQTVKVKGPKGPAGSWRCPRRRRGASSRTGSGHGRRRGSATKPGAGDVGHLHARWSPSWSRASPRAIERQALRSMASATAPRCRARTCSCSSATAHDVVYPIPEGIAITAPKPTEIVITGIDRPAAVGQVAAEIRSLPSSRSPTRARA